MMGSSEFYHLHELAKSHQYTLGIRSMAYALTSFCIDQAVVRPEISVTIGLSTIYKIVSFVTVI